MICFRCGADLLPCPSAPGVWMSEHPDPLYCPVADGLHSAISQAAYEDMQRKADLQAHVSGQGGPSPAWITDDAAGAR